MNNKANNKRNPEAKMTNKIFEEMRADAITDLGMTGIQATAFVFIIASGLAKKYGKTEAYNHFEMRLAEMGVK